MILKQYYLRCLAYASYLIADQVGGQPAVIDPQRDIQQYLADAEHLHCEIRHVFLTHLHADFIAGHLELRRRAGAPIHLGAAATAEYAFRPIADGDELRLGQVRLSVLQTPGHSPESISILVLDPEHGDDRPSAVLTGDTLFIGEVGRPDVRASLGWSAEQLASMLYDSLHDKLLPLPDDTLVYPAHGAGSLCGRNLSTDAVSTIGAERKYNYALQPMSGERFTKIVTTDQPDAPAYFTYDAVLNARERPTLDDALARELRPLSLAEMIELVADGAQLLDTREPAEFERAHIRGAINVGLVGSFLPLGVAPSSIQNDRLSWSPNPSLSTRPRRGSGASALTRLRATSRPRSSNSTTPPNSLTGSTAPRPAPLPSSLPRPRHRC